MVSAAVRQILATLWTDRCTIITHEAVTDPETFLTDFADATLYEDLPCKLSFESIAAAAGDEAASVAQSVKLFLSPDVTVPAGSKVVVTRPNGTERSFTYKRSGEPAIYSNHQEIDLELFKGWA